MYVSILNSGSGCTDVGKPNRSFVNRFLDRSLFLNCIFFIGLSCFCPILIIGCEREEDVSEPTETLPVQQLDSFSTQHREAGILKWTLVGDASKLVSHNSRTVGDEMIVQNPIVEIYEEGKISLKITAKTGKYYPSGKNKNDLFLYDDVVGMNEKGQLFTKELQWRNKDGTLYSPVEVKIVRGDSTWYGTEMVANPDLETIKMSNNRFTLYPKDEEVNEDDEWQDNERQ